MQSSSRVCWIYVYSPERPSGFGVVRSTRDSRIQETRNRTASPWSGLCPNLAQPKRVAVLAGGVHLPNSLNRGSGSRQSRLSRCLSRFFPPRYGIGRLWMKMKDGLTAHCRAARSRIDFRGGRGWRVFGETKVSTDPNTNFALYGFESELELKGYRIGSEAEARARSLDSREGKPVDRDIHGCTKPGLRRQPWELKCGPQRPWVRIPPGPL